MLKHIVFWKIDEGNIEERARTIAEFTKKTEYLKSIIPEILEAKVGTNIVEGDEYHVCIDSVFDNVDTLNTYIEHPEHLKVRAFLNEHAYEKAIFDYEY